MIRHIAAVAVAALALTAPSSGSGQTTTAKFGVWTVHMKVVNYNLKTGDFNTPNHISMTRIGGDVNADRATGNVKRKNAVLTGHVVLHDASGSIAPHAPGSAPSLGAGGPLTLTADLVRIDQSASNYVAIGSVHYEQGAIVLDAQTGTLDQTTHVMTADGDVHIRQGERTLIAQHVSCDTVTTQCQARSGTVDLPAAGLPGGGP